MAQQVELGLEFEDLDNYFRPNDELGEQQYATASTSSWGTPEQLLEQDTFGRAPLPEIQSFLTPIDVAPAYEDFDHKHVAYAQGPILSQEQGHYISIAHHHHHHHQLHHQLHQQQMHRMMKQHEPAHHQQQQYSQVVQMRPSVVNYAPGGVYAPPYDGYATVSTAYETPKFEGDVYSPPPQDPLIRTVVLVEEKKRPRTAAVTCHKDSKCANCKTRETTLWRRNQKGEIECNACNLYFRKNNFARPLSLCKNHIVKRNRKPRQQERYVYYERHSDEDVENNAKNVCSR